MEALKMAKLKALKQLVTEMFKLEAKEHGGDLPKAETAPKVMADDALEPDMSPDIAKPEVEGEDADRKSFMKRGNKMPVKGKTKAIMAIMTAKTAAKKRYGS